jgi:hypothetical protein
MESLILLELLKLFWLGFEVFKHFVAREREKAMIETLDKYNQRLCKLENEQRKTP